MWKRSLCRFKYSCEKKKKKKKKKKNSYGSESAYVDKLSTFHNSLIAILELQELVHQEANNSFYCCEDIFNSFSFIEYVT